MTRQVRGEACPRRGTGLHPKLAEVMIGVQPSPAVPLAGRQPAEHRVRLEVVTAPRRELLDERFELLTIARELHRLGAADFLIDLGARLHRRAAMSPAHAARSTCMTVRENGVATGTERSRAHHRPERIAQMTDGLVRCHPSPPPRTVGREPLQPRDDARRAALGRRASPSSREQPRTRPPTTNHQLLQAG